MRESPRISFAGLLGPCVTCSAAAPSQGLRLWVVMHCVNQDCSREVIAVSEALLVNRHADISQGADVKAGADSSRSNSAIIQEIQTTEAGPLWTHTGSLTVAEVFRNRRNLYEGQLGSIWKQLLTFKLNPSIRSQIGFRNTFWNLYQAKCRGLPIPLPHIAHIGADIPHLYLGSPIKALYTNYQGPLSKVSTQIFQKLKECSRNDE